MLLTLIFAGIMGRLYSNAQDRSSRLWWGIVAVIGTAIGIDQGYYWSIFPHALYSGDEWRLLGQTKNQLLAWAMSVAAFASSIIYNLIGVRWFPTSHFRWQTGVPRVQLDIYPRSKFAFLRIFGIEQMVVVVDRAAIMQNGKPKSLKSAEAFQINTGNIVAFSGVTLDRGQFEGVQVEADYWLGNEDVWVRGSYANGLPWSAKAKVVVHEPI